ncbi:hypothetical protein pEaSNUABM50_00210 [Erwinia phage pEa_SNUABM_50]|uniref:Uncharacterized protein n=4 Tax=Eneladusvirus BF TaxID=2560751 RepID=A0A7L8ZMI3_9CAUD|nr:hypothetical protein FDH34_gp214 [Serratia phage BF]QOI71151.1 hypothetical protein pEaSNUABM12_00213 [Erwinia phage pEa_SNUABM_12]QOI71695.1 hypothetical protein pEaSNUABM47_00211 [Erwinia phage pEa_SNUABM_47]QOI72234.1 hypothetical protein pEaSNUABM50_00210 [Erwinia phage pEa_SNUABM_50]QXO11360.1 hypothetical protein pEaSNUABM19_00214 [Erwinia phage pEa_SNUABM_19]QXO11908.1 hypothetical protein pEaSNUABM44_00212 [Erwinia phage pEa_SNUABM_44]QXO12460.1 hypothetical protein pEaSNUABM49_002
MSKEVDIQDLDEVVAGPQLEFIDIINATKIMEAAIERKAFSIKELGEVAPIVSRFQEFSQAIIAEQEAKDANTEGDA